PTHRMGQAQVAGRGRGHRLKETLELAGIKSLGQLRSHPCEPDSHLPCVWSQSLDIQEVYISGQSFDVSGIPKSVIRTVLVFRARSLGGNENEKRRGSRCL